MSLEVKTYPGMSRAHLEDILRAMQAVRAVLLGDVCLDVYWQADMRLSELSRETPHYPLPVVEERMTPGGGGNVAANLAALQPANLAVVGAIGADWRGRELKRLLDGLDADTTGLVENPKFTTNAYIKPLRSGISSVVYEDPRLDFAMHQPVDAATGQAVLEALNTAVARGADVLCVSDQMPFGVVSEPVRRRVLELAKQGLPVVVDSRDRITQYCGAILKPNEVEGAHAVGLGQPPAGDTGALANIAQALAAQNGAPVFMTIGALGAIYAGGGELWHLHGHPVAGPIDFVGAGDSSLSGFSLAVAAGAAPHEAAYIAGLCSEVTIQQVGTTGTAPAGAILRWHGTLPEGAT